jgi:putative NIF3 family GTP cyclohydrolase 1 type 2
MAGGAAAASLPVYGASPVTAGAIVERLQSALGGEWPASGVDGFKAGDPGTPVKGIATTAMATMDVLKRAVKENTNLILTYEPTFYGKQDGRPPAPQSGGINGPAPARGPQGVTQDDPVHIAKKEFVDKNGLVIFRLHEHWRSQKDDGMTTGLADALGWTRFRLTTRDAIYEIPSTTAEDVVALLRKKLNLRGGLRAVGDRRLPVRRVSLYPGVLAPATMWQRYTETDLMVTGEVREWENTFYAADMFTAGEKRGLITIGRVASEDPGMNACASWLRTIVREVPTHWISAGDLYWRAQS